MGALHRFGPLFRGFAEPFPGFCKVLFNTFPVIIAGAETVLRIGKENFREGGSVVRPRRMPEAVKQTAGVCYWKTIWKNLYRCGLTLDGS